MIKIESTVVKKLPKFWNNAVFHPTDGVEDPWGKRILDRMAKDGALQTVRIYSMFEDIVYIGENGELCYDYRVSDLRLDYLTEKGYDLLIAYGGMPDCIAASVANKTNVSKNKTRYKGKMWNSAPPKDYTLWEEICYEYTKHNVERYGIEAVSKWRLQCFNEPDIASFFFSEYPCNEEMTQKHRLPAYCRMYAAFERGVRRVSERIQIGGPALALRTSFLEGFLNYVGEHRLKLDFISVHNYGTSPRELNNGSKPIDVQNNLDKLRSIVQTVNSCGFGNTPLYVDEWGFASAGFFNCEDCPALMGRETELFSAYFAKLIQKLSYSDFNVEMLAICLSGQHEMVTDFSGFRNFFTLNFIAKPIYNAHVLASRLGENLLSAECDEHNTFVLPTRDNDGNYAIILSYSSDTFEDELPTVNENLVFSEDISDRNVTLYRIDRNHTNPYRMWECMGQPEMTEDVLKALREEGNLKPVGVQKGSEPLNLELTANATYLITVTK